MSAQITFDVAVFAPDLGKLLTLSQTVEVLGGPEQADQCAQNLRKNKRVSNVVIQTM